MRKMKQPIRRDPARWMEGHVPPGLDWRAECRWAAVGLILGALSCSSTGWTGRWTFSTSG